MGWPILVRLTGLRRPTRFTCRWPSPTTRGGLNILPRNGGRVAPVKVGGVAYGDRGEDFVPGRYVKPGYVFTSRGCPRRCWFCSVWKRDPVPRLLPVTDGWNILDDNLLACPRGHVEAVFAMLRRQKRRMEFTGGLEALALEDYQVAGASNPALLIAISGSGPETP